MKNKKLHLCIWIPLIGIIVCFALLIGFGKAKDTTAHFQPKFSQLVVVEK